MADKLKSEEERATEARQKREMAEVESKVDRDIEQIAARIAASHHKGSGAQQQGRFFSKMRVQQGPGQSSTRQL